MKKKIDLKKIISKRSPVHCPPYHHSLLIVIGAEIIRIINKDIKPINNHQTKKRQNNPNHP